MSSFASCPSPDHCSSWSGRSGGARSGAAGRPAGRLDIATVQPAHFSLCAASALGVRCLSRPVRPALPRVPALPRLEPCTAEAPRQARPLRRARALIRFEPTDARVSCVRKREIPQEEGTNLSRTLFALRRASGKRNESMCPIVPQKK